MHEKHELASDLDQRSPIFLISVEENLAFGIRRNRQNQTLSYKKRQSIVLETPINLKRDAPRGYSSQCQYG